MAEEDTRRQENAMPRYLIQASYTAEAAAAFVRKPQDRVEGVRSLVQGLGGQLDSFDYCLGEYDVMATYTAPDDVTATAVSLAVLAPGHLKAFRTTKLLTPDEFMEASRKASGTDYRAPSGD
jgi:uncharacterized protein with GYD domain